MGKALVHVRAFTLLPPYTCTPARGASIQTLKMRTRANMKKPIRERFQFGQTLKVRKQLFVSRFRIKVNSFIHASGLPTYSMKKDSSL